MNRFYLFLLAVALLMCTPLLTSCSDSDSNDAPAEKTLSFYVMLSYSETDLELYNGDEVSKELQTLTTQTLTQTLGGKTTVVVAEKEVSTVLDNVKQAFDKLVAETNAKHAYPGLYTFTVKCNEKEVTQATFYTNDLWALAKVHNTISYTPQDENGEQKVVPLTTEKSPSAAYNILTTLELSRPKDYSFSYTGDETLVQEVSNVYGELVESFPHNLREILVKINKAKSIKKDLTGVSILNGGEYSVSVHCDYLEYSENITNLYITEDPGISITSATVGETNTVFQLNITTGYPFNVDDYKNDIILNATILQEVDEGKDEVIAELPLTVKLVDDPSRTRVAACKTIDIHTIATPSLGHYKVRIASDWKPGNKEGEFFFKPGKE